MGKLDLMTKMQESGFFVYGLASSQGMVHYDTFANVVAESVASGVIVLAPRIAALPYLYEGMVQFVDPPNGYSHMNAHSTFSARDTSGLASDAMTKRYVERIRQIVSNATLAKEIRNRGRKLAHDHFAASTVSSRIFAVLTGRPAESAAEK